MRRVARVARPESSKGVGTADRFRFPGPRVCGVGETRAQRGNRRWGAGCPSSRRKRKNESVLTLERPDEPVIGSHEIAAMLLGECDVETVVDANSHLR
jgi:hypothetical protein